MKRNKAQVTLFVILAIMIFTAIILIFIISRNQVETRAPITENPAPFLAKCSEDATRQAIQAVMPMGGYIENKLNITYQGQDIAYVCYTSEYNKPCTNQEPLYLKHLQKEITTYITAPIEECYDTLNEEYLEQGIATSISSNTDVQVKIQPGIVSIDVNKEFSFEKAGESKQINNILAFVDTNLYDITSTVEEIIYHESQFCNFDQNAYLLFNQGLAINKTGLNDGTKIYNIIQDKTGLTTNLAIRGCVLQLSI